MTALVVATLLVQSGAAATYQVLGLRAFDKL
jgi:hypothetical protein